MIQDFRHKGLLQFFETGSTAGIQASLARKLRLQLAALHSATQIEDMDMPGYHLHLLKGADKARWSIWVNGNWRLTFAFRDGHVFDLDEFRTSILDSVTHKCVRAPMPAATLLT